MATPHGKAETADTLYRHWLMLKMIPRRGRISTNVIRDRLELDHGIPTTLRTVQRDLRSLSRPFPLVCDEAKPQGWSWKRDAQLLDIPNMDPQTAMAFRLVEKFLKHLVPRTTLTAIAPFFDHAGTVLEHCTDHHSCAWPDKVRVISRSELLQPPHVDSAVADTLYDALYEGRRCRVEYQPKGDGPVKGYELNPLGLVFVDKVPYLVATVGQYHDIRQMPLQRFRTVVLLDTPAVIPPGFTLQGYIDSGEFHYVVGGEPIILQFRMAADRAKHLEETPLADDQIVTPGEDDTVTVQATKLKV